MANTPMDIKNKSEVIADQAKTQVSETQAPGVQASEAQAPETQAPEAQAPEAQAPEAQAPEAQAPEAQAPEAQASKKPSPKTPSSKKHWSSMREAGTYQGLLFLLWVHKIFGRTIFSVVLFFVTIYFIIFLSTARRASKEFLLTHYQCCPDYWVRKPNLNDTFKHFFSFGQSILDKLLAWTIPMSEDEFEIADEVFLKEFLNDEKGQLIIGSHVGNLEYCRGFVQRYKSKTINVLVYDQHAANFVEMMQSVNAESRIHVYQVDQLDIPMILSLKEKIERGEWLFIAGDRIPLSGEGRTVTVDFMGRKAQLPIGPYILAKTLQCPVKLMFSYRVNKKVFFDVIPFADKVTLPRGKQDDAIQQYAQTFANALQKQCFKAPMQWFNFYPYWSDSGGDNKQNHKHKS